MRNLLSIINSGSLTKLAFGPFALGLFFAMVREVSSQPEKFGPSSTFGFGAVVGLMVGVAFMITVNEVLRLYRNWAWSRKTRHDESGSK